MITTIAYINVLLSHVYLFSDCFFIDSAATSYEEIGNPVYPGARKKLAEAGISCEGKRKKGEEKGMFLFGGSTIIVLVKKEQVKSKKEGK